MPERAPRTASWGMQLRWYRESVRQETREEFAESLNQVAYSMGQNVACGARLVARWESGEVKWPRPVYRRLLATMEAPLPGTAMALPWEVDPVVVSLTGGSDEEEDEVDRRQFLGIGGAAAVEVLAEPWQRLAYALDRKSRSVDARAVDAIEARTARFFDAQDHVPSRKLVKHLGAYLDAVSTLIPDAGTEVVRKRLVSNAGAAAALAGWVAFDGRDIESSRHYYDTAAKAANEAENDSLQGCVLAYRSYAASAAGNPGEARSMLLQAQDRIRSERQPRMQAWLAAREGEESAALGDRDGTLRALERGHIAHDYIDGSQEPIWVNFFTAVRLEGIAASSYGRLKHADMESSAQRVLEMVDTCKNKADATALGDVACGYFLAGEVDQGAVVARRAADAICQWQARLGYERLKGIEEATEPYASAPAVRELREQLSALAEAH